VGFNIALISGEMSGDAVGAALARELKHRCPDVELWGLGSRRMADAGVDLLYDTSVWSAIGVIEALRVYPPLRFRVYPHVLAEADRRKPAVVVPIDFGAFNVRAAAKMKARGIPVLYYFPPGSWRRGGSAGSGLAAVTDRIATPFPWSANRLNAAGAHAVFVGHPMLDMAKATYTRAEFADSLGMEPGCPIVGLLPGSRGFEVRYNTPAMLAAAELIHRREPRAQFVLGVAPNTSSDVVAEMIRRHQRRQDTVRTAPERGTQEGSRRARVDPMLITPEGIAVPGAPYERWLQDRRSSLTGDRRTASPPFVMAGGMAYDVMAHSDALIVCSGTATLEAAVIGTPMAIIYRGSGLMWAEARLRRADRVEHIGMPNIVAGERIVPEYRQNEATPEALADAVMMQLTDAAYRARTKDALRRVREALGEPGASGRVADMVLEMASEKTR
jgi:lipid-A-disaccharide synthase